MSIITTLKGSDDDQPRLLNPGRSASDHVFRWSIGTIASLVLVIFGSIGLFLAYQSRPTIHRYGFNFLIGHQWSPSRNIFGLSSTLLGSVEVALIALLIAFPLALATALFVSEYAPPRAKSFLTGLIDLMAAVPSIVYGLWGVLLLQPHAKFIARWLHQNLGWFPLFRVNGDPNSATWAQSDYVSSAFIAGIAVAMMVLPISAAVMRGVFAQAPVGEREAAYALGSTRSGMIRTVVIPFGRGGIIGGTMLGLGRALGETIAVLLIFSQDFRFNFRPLQSGFDTISALIANDFGAASKSELAALLTAGFVLFLLTLAVNTVAAIFVGRGRSGATTEI